MDISKRNAVRIVSFTVAVVGVLAVRNIQLMSSDKRALRSVSYTYSRAMGVLGKGGSVTASHRRAAA